MLHLSNDLYTVGIAPRLGGRVVLFQRKGGKNVLHSTPAYWNDSEEQIPACVPNSTFKPYNGHIVWVGPQKDWWIQQDVNPDRKKHRAVWPPDPFLVFANYPVVSQSATAVTLVGPASPISGVQLTKEVRFDRDQVVLRVTARNIRPTPVSWDLWSNTRLPGDARCYAGVDKASSIRIEHGVAPAGTSGVLPYRIEDGFFTFDAPAEVPRGIQSLSAKVFVNGARAGALAAFHDRACFVKRFDPTPTEQVHRDQAGVEIYQNLAANPDDRILELEAHGAYRTLPPGGTLSFEERWIILPYRGANRIASHIRFLKKIGL